MSIRFTVLVVLLAFCMMAISPVLEAQGGKGRGPRHGGSPGKGGPRGGGPASSGVVLSFGNGGLSASFGPGPGWNAGPGPVVVPWVNPWIDPWPIGAGGIGPGNLQVPPGQSTYIRPRSITSTGIPPMWPATPWLAPADGPQAAVPSAGYTDRARAAFWSGAYFDAARLVSHALIEHPDDGRLMLFAAQCQLAVGDFEMAARLTGEATQRLPVEAWGQVVAGFRDYYGRDDYAGQIAALESAVRDPRASADAVALLGYQYFYLGYGEPARQMLQRAVVMDPACLLGTQMLAALYPAVAPGPPAPVISHPVPGPSPGILPAPPRAEEVPAPGNLP